MDSFYIIPIRPLTTKQSLNVVVIFSSLKCACVYHLCKGHNSIS
jgi:hypothetical protein